MPQGAEFLKCCCVGDKKVAAICKDRKDGAEYYFSIVPGGEAFASCPKLSDCREGGLGVRQPSSEVDRRLARWGEQVAKPP